MDSWLDPDDSSPFPELGDWTGATRFVVEGSVIPEYLKDIRVHRPRGRAAVLADLDAGIRRDDLSDGNFSIAEVERERLVADQKVCPEIGPIYLMTEARQAGKDVRHEWNKFKRLAPEVFRNNVSAETVIRQSEKFEIHDHLLFKKVFDAAEGEIQLRPAVPTGSTSAMELPGYGRRPLSMRNRLLLEYHNGILGGHQGRDTTMDRLEKDWWWPGMYRDVCGWSQHCEMCQREHSRSGASAWTRTQLYTRPFQVLEFDLVTCRDVAADAGFDGALTGAKYILTAICCFSKFPWLIPLRDKTAKTVARALLERVLINFAMFPSVLRSDNDPDFTGLVVSHMNRLLNIKHVFGSAYHPQSQGQVENMHRTMTQVLRKLLQEKPQEWEELLPYCECILRITPLKSLGGRSPYHVVTGLNPRLPRAVMISGASGVLSADDYVDKLMSYLKTAYDDIYRKQNDAREEHELEDSQKGSASAELDVGDVVVLKLPPTTTRKGPKRFTERTRKQLWRVYKKVGPNTFYLEDANDPSIKNPYSQHAENIIKLNIPDLALEPTRSRQLEIFNNESGAWERFRVERHSIDGRSLLRRLHLSDDPNEPLDVEEPNAAWHDLSENLYRWIV